MTGPTEIRPAPVLMVQGTTSGAGKSLLTAALCRILHRRGVAVAPFKAQNMSNNAAVTVEGGEIGRAQALQARAAGVEPQVRMNPILLKPLADTRSEVVVLGKGRPELSALPWRERRHLLWPPVVESLASLRRDFQVVVVEGAGSPAEINLRESDIVNMAVARHTDAAVLLVTDIDRGGAFATLFGTWALLDDEDRRTIRGFILNRFRGDASLLEPAPRLLEERTGVPTVGVVPWMRHLLPEEDGGPRLEWSRSPDSWRIGVLRFPHLANADDLDPLRAEPEVEVVWVSELSDLFGLDAVLLPGSRNTLGDLAWLHRTGLGHGLKGLHQAGTPLVGICAGYQMMGRAIRDPEGLEEGGVLPGLDILPLDTTLAREKDTRLTRGRVGPGAHLFAELMGEEVAGYEIHHGRTRLLEDSGKTHLSASAGVVPWLVDGRRALGHASGRTWGGYLHGVMENPGLRNAWLTSLGIRPAEESSGPWQHRVDRELDRVADGVQAGLQMDRILSWVGLEGC